MTAPTRTILHVDLDAFFAAVEQRDDPALRGKPVIVGGGGPEDRGVVSTASYEARRFGVRSAMPLRTAAALCPHGIFVPVDGRKYAAESRDVLGILRRFTPLVEPVSIDEAFLDVTASGALFGSGRDVALAIKRAVVAETQLTASVGVAPSKLVAKIASDLRKPDGLVVVEPGEEPAFLAPLPISRLWGIGERTAAALRQYGIATLGDLQRAPEDLLVRGMGPHASTLRARALGIDDAPVSDAGPAKSISHEHTFDVDTDDLEVIEKTLLAMADGVAARLRAAGLMAGTVHVKVRDSTFLTVTRQRSLPEPSDLAEPIWRVALALARPEVRGRRIRLLGVGASNFDRPSQIGLFTVEEERRRRATLASDRLRNRYGDRVVVRARLLDRSLPAPFERDVMRPVDRSSLRATGREHDGHEPVEFVPVEEEVRFTEGDA